MLKAIGLLLILVSLAATTLPSEATPMKCHHRHHCKVA
jgi:hypothetical protein